MNTESKQPTGIAPLLFKWQAAEIVGGAALLDQMVRRRQINVIRLGHRSVRFRREDLEAALLRLTVRAVV